MYHTWENIRKSYKNKKIETSTPKMYDKFEISDGKNSVSDI